MSASSSDKPSLSVGSMLISIGLSLWIVVAFFLAQAIVQASLAILAFLGVSLAGLNDAVLNAVFAAVTYMVTLLIVLGVPIAMKKSKGLRKTLGLERLVNWGDLILGPIGFIPYIVLATVLGMIATGLFSGFDPTQAQNVGFENLAQRYEYLLAFVTLVIVAPVAEEVIFRGYLYGEIRKRSGIATAFLLVSVCFALLHLQINVAINVFALSIVLCALREITGSIWAGIILHMLKNGVAFYFLFVQPMIQ